MVINISVFQHLVDLCNVRFFKINLSPLKSTLQYFWPQSFKYEHYFFLKFKSLHNSNGYSTENMSGRAHIFHESFEKLKIYQQVFVSKSLYCKVSEAKRTAQT